MRRSVLNSQSPDFVWSRSLPNFRDQDVEDLVDSTSDIPTTYDDPILDFTRFMNVSELNIDWDQMILDSISNGPSAVNATTQEAQSVTPEMSDISSRIPDDDNDFQELKPVRCPWLFPASHRADFPETLNPFLHILSDFHLPSRLSIARYLSGYVDGFSNHHPFIHVPTLRHLSFEHSPELYLAILCIGAQYRYETTTARHLYQSSRSIILERLRRGDFFCPKNPLPCDIDISKKSSSTFGWMHRVRALILLTIYASWQKEAALVQEAFEFQGLISRYVREVGLDETSDAPGENWLIWSRNETARRTKFYAYCLLNLHSFAFDTPPLLLSRELNLYLPSSCKEWIARKQAEWMASRPRSPIPAMFKSVHGSHSSWLSSGHRR
ncbi:hypothetical protein N7488_010430 [Penicillium malachiteum]|nr:hypothetical protein N7488_010430 [Penicillium malachiteum]